MLLCSPLRHSCDLKERLAHLGKCLLGYIKLNGLRRLKPKKCNLLYDRTCMLSRIHPDPAKRHYPHPTDATKVESQYVGLALGFIRSFIAAPLRQIHLLDHQCPAGKLPRRLVRSQDGPTCRMVCVHRTVSAITAQDPPSCGFK